MGEQIGPDGEIESVVSYVVDVRPKGPVPVAALEWRIREDVPTNLRAVKAATLGMVGASSSSMELAAVGATYGTLGTDDARNSRSRSPNSSTRTIPVPLASRRTRQLATVMVDWERGETMAKYLE